MASTLRTPPGALSDQPLAQFDQAWSQDPDLAWHHLKRSQVFLPVTPPPAGPAPEGHLRIVCVSDTHGRTGNLQPPEGDVLVHAGDFSMTGKPHEVAQFNQWLGSLPHRHKIVIAGNHDGPFDTDWYLGGGRKFLQHDNDVDPAVVRAMLTNCRYLQDEEVVLDGVRFYGAPWQPEFCAWAFNVNRGRLLDQHWSKIPAGIDVLITHGPPLGRGDETSRSVRAGCVDLLRHVQCRVIPKVHVFGHIHEGYGTSSDGTTVYVNASTCNLKYRPLNAPIVVDVRKPS